MAGNYSKRVLIFKKRNVFQCGIGIHNFAVLATQNLGEKFAVARKVCLLLRNLIAEIRQRRKAIVQRLKLRFLIEIIHHNGSEVTGILIAYTVVGHGDFRKRKGSQNRYIRVAPELPIFAQTASVSANLFLFTPPFTQLNTPYPATAYLKGFLNTKGIASYQADLGIDVVLRLFCKDGLERLFRRFDASQPANISENAQRISRLRSDYSQTIDAVILFLQGKNPTLALQICQDGFLPEASRFDQLADLDWAFGTLGTQDKAKHLATLYLEDLSDFIVECIDPHFGFSRYAERLGRSANSFDELYMELQNQPSFTDETLFDVLDEKMRSNPDLVLISVPFPGNLYAAFRSAQWIKNHYPDTKIAMGGGFANTELRSIADARVFSFFDFITLDDGERPVELLVEYVNGHRSVDNLKRTFICRDGKVRYIDNSGLADYKQSEVGTPDYEGLPLDRYISVLEMANPMHRMWSDGRWNKLTMAHGCYWGKCTFCDISLDYIKRYEPTAASMLVDRMEEMLSATGESGFHFVDEAAPPALMRDLAIEIIRRNLSVTWWTNIRFEKSFTADLCRLLRASGCVAVSGGLEVASDRLLALIDKGVTVAQVAQVTRNFTESGIMVHAYLMYGYPTQTVQETVDSLEMVRQLFEAGTIQSGFWHQFALTAHSPVGLYPSRFNIVAQETTGAFANNDLEYTDPTGIDHSQFNFGLRKSLYNFMHGIGLDFPLQDWFDFKIPKTTVSPDFVHDALGQTRDFSIRGNAKLIWLGSKPQVSTVVKSKKGQTFYNTLLTVHTRRESLSISFDKQQGEWMARAIDKILIANPPMTLAKLKANFENEWPDFELFWFSKPVEQLRQVGLLAV